MCFYQNTQALKIRMKGHQSWKSLCNVCIFISLHHSSTLHSYCGRGSISVQRRPCPNLWNLRRCYFLWQKGPNSWDKVKGLELGRLLLLWYLLFFSKYPIPIRKKMSLFTRFIIWNIFYFPINWDWVWLTSKCYLCNSSWA